MLFRRRYQQRYLKSVSQPEGSDSFVFNVCKIRLVMLSWLRVKGFQMLSYSQEVDASDSEDLQCFVPTE
ncbi:hypothetical protein CVT26_010144 [Gymnopilus dilepis]|uniref:Uncharacterized protein n=1 Tax=Gymnopilus dilepis TaxID=231916 RepID=A0A409YS70_9AGAR|nr:hypothetical protein CVT26_010144 [Gymnopilus dilepis]